MNLSTVVCLQLALAILSAPAVRAESPARDRAIAEAAARLLPKLVETRRDFHRHPELSNREERTSGIVAERLRALGGIEVRTGVARYGVVGVLRGGRPGPVVALRADMDALPIDEVNDVPYRSGTAGVKHACGHDAHTSILLGVAEVLAGMRAEIGGTVVFLFQPSEEGAPNGELGGAPLMIKEGALANPRPDAIFGLHVMPTLEAGTVGYMSGPAMASSDKFTITIHGTSSHGANPQDSVDAVYVAAECIQALQSIRSRRTNPQEGFVLSIGQITGGNRFNIIADEVTLVGTMRVLDEKTRENAVQWIRQILGGVTSAHGATYELNLMESAAVTFNDPQLVAASLPSFKRAIGDANVIGMRPVMVAEDFSYYQREVPGFFFFLGVRNEAKGFTAMLHTPAFDLDEDAMRTGVTAMATVALDFLDRTKGRK